MTDLNAETQAYIECALWSSSIEANDFDMPDDTSMESAGYTREDIEPATLASMEADVHAFIADSRIAPALDFWAAELGVGQIGHDFWLTRNRHGAGFWDRFYGDSMGARYGAQLTAVAQPYGEFYFFVGEDGMIYGS